MHPLLPHSGAIAGGILAGLVVVAILISITIIVGVCVYCRSLHDHSTITDLVRLCVSIIM